MKPKPNAFKQSLPNVIGKKGEQHTQKRLGGKLTPGSRGGDLRVHNLLVEKKSTSKDSIVVKKDYLVKIERIAFASSRIPILAIEFDTLDRTFVSKEWAVVPMHYLKELLEKLKSND